MDRSPVGHPELNYACPYCGEAPIKPHFVYCPVCSRKLTSSTHHSEGNKKVPTATSQVVEVEGPQHSVVKNGGSNGASATSREFELISPDDVEWGEKLGEGSYGVVYRGKVRGTPVALKTVRPFEAAVNQTPHQPKDEKSLQLIRNKISKQLEVLKAEQAVVRQVYNPYICLYLGHTRDSHNALVLVSELMETDLDSYIKKNPGGPSLFACMSIAHCIAQGMSWIGNSVVHADLKPSNVLLSGLDSNGQWTSNSVCKVCDFGLSVVASLAANVRGTPVYQSPEAINGQRVTSKSDVFSFGWMMVNLALWKPEKKLFRSIKTVQQLKSFVNDERQRLEFVRKYLGGQNTPQVIIDTIVGCLRGNVEQRFSFKDIIQAFERDIFLHSAIHVPGSLAMTFWVKYFDRRHEISFDELLAAMMNEAMQSKDSAVVSEFPLSKEQIHFVHLLFVQDSVRASVSMERFGRVCALLGPFDVPGFVTRVGALFKHRWFFGEMLTTAAAYALSNERAGTFLVRFANHPKRVSDFAISRCFPSEGYIHHMHIRHLPEQAQFSMATEDIDMSGMKSHKVTALRATYASLVDLINGVKDALELREPLISIPRLLVGQNVKHNGYFVRAFMSDSEDERDGSAGEATVSPVDPEDDGNITPLKSKDYKRAARLIGLLPEKDPHQKSSANTLRGRALRMTCDAFFRICGPLNLSVGAADPCPMDYRSQRVVEHRGNHAFRLSMFDLPLSKAYNRQKGGPACPTRDGGGLLSSFCYVMNGLALPNFVDIMMKDVITWLRSNGKQHVISGFTKTLEELCAPVSMDTYLSFLERGSPSKCVYGDIFILAALCQMYRVSIICVCDNPVESVDESGAAAVDIMSSPKEWGPYVYTLEAPSPCDRFVVLGISMGGRMFNPLLPEAIAASLARACGINKSE